MKSQREILCKNNCLRIQVVKQHTASKVKEKRMPKKQQQIENIKSDIKRVKKDLRKQNQTLEALTERLAELEVYSSSSEEELPTIKIGTRVRSTTNPNKNRTGVVTWAEPYWITVKADWEIVLKSGKTSSEFTKARHNLEVIEEWSKTSANNKTHRVGPKGRQGLREGARRVPDREDSGEERGRGKDASPRKRSSKGQRKR